jgi:hypothetical protein
MKGEIEVKKIDAYLTDSISDCLLGPLANPPSAVLQLSRNLEAPMGSICATKKETVRNENRAS